LPISRGSEKENPLFTRPSLWKAKEIQSCRQFQITGGENSSSAISSAR
jgi:hypothetical protein